MSKWIPLLCYHIASLLPSSIHILRLSFLSFLSFVSFGSLCRFYFLFSFCLRVLSEFHFFSISAHTTNKLGTSWKYLTERLTRAWNPLYRRWAIRKDQSSWLTHSLHIQGLYQVGQYCGVRISHEQDSEQGLERTSQSMLGLWDIYWFRTRTVFSLKYPNPGEDTLTPFMTKPVVEIL